MNKRDYTASAGVGYTIDIGPYHIYWSTWDDDIDRCIVTCIPDTITLDDSPLPFDVGEDTLKLYMVFS